MRALATEELREKNFTENLALLADWKKHPEKGWWFKGGSGRSVKDGEEEDGGEEQGEEEESEG